jgi:hypothetical protein
MHRICTKYAKNICKNMQIYAMYMQKYANICSTVCATEICKNMQKYAKYMHAICKNMQNMQSRFLYAEYAKICTPHFADDCHGCDSLKRRRHSSALHCTSRLVSIVTVIKL